jgi:response regulator of citrate/malate metabolism
MVEDWLQAEAEIDRLLQKQEDSGSVEFPVKPVNLEKLEASYRDWDSKHETLKIRANEASMAKFGIRKGIEAFAGKRAEFEIITKYLRQHTGRYLARFEIDGRKCSEGVARGLPASSSA